MADHQNCTLIPNPETMESWIRVLSAENLQTLIVKIFEHIGFENMEEKNKHLINRNLFLVSSPDA